MFSWGKHLQCVSIWSSLGYRLVLSLSFPPSFPNSLMISPVISSPFTHWCHLIERQSHKSVIESLFSISDAALLLRPFFRQEVEGTSCECISRCWQNTTSDVRCTIFFLFRSFLSSASSAIRWQQFLSSLLSHTSSLCNDCKWFSCSAGLVWQEKATEQKIATGSHFPGSWSCSAARTHVCYLLWSTATKKNTENPEYVLEKMPLSLSLFPNHPLSSLYFFFPLIIQRPANMTFMSKVK